MSTKIIAVLLMLSVMSCSYAIGQEIQRITITKTYVCSNYDYVVNDLQERYGESKKGYGLSSQNELVELFVNDVSGVWTVIFTNPRSNLTCGLIGGSKGFTFQTDTPSGHQL